jgi:hypothetical protein
LEEKLTITEYLGWVEYFKEISRDDAPAKANLMTQDEKGILKGFGL